MSTYEFMFSHKFIKMKVIIFNNVIGLFKYDIDNTGGAAELKIWEWK